MITSPKSCDSSSTWTLDATEEEECPATERSPVSSTPPSKDSYTINGVWTVQAYSHAHAVNLVTRLYF